MSRPGRFQATHVIPCPWGIPTDDAEEELLPAFISTLAPLNYIPSFDQPPPKRSLLGRVKNKLTTRTNYRNPPPSGPYNPAICPGTRPHYGWLNTYNIGSNDNDYFFALPAAATASRFPAPDYSAPPPGPPTAMSNTPVRVGGSDTIIRSNSAILASGRGLSNFSVMQSSNATITNVGSTNTSVFQYSSNSLNLAHPMHRDALNSDTPIPPANTEATTISEFSTPSLQTRSVVDHSSSFNSNHNAYVPTSAYPHSVPLPDNAPAFTPPSTPPAATSAPAVFFQAGKTSLMRAGPSTIPEEPPEGDPHSGREGAALGAPLGANRAHSGVPSVSSQFILPELSAQEVSRHVEARHAEGQGGEVRARLARIKHAVINAQELGLSQQLLEQFHLTSTAHAVEGSNSVMLKVSSTVDKQEYVLKFYGSLEALAVTSGMLEHRDRALSLVLPPVRYADNTEHRTALEGRVVVMKAGTTLEHLLQDVPSVIQSPKHLVHLLTRLALLLDTLHRHRRSHGNLSSHHIYADTTEEPYVYHLIDMSCSRSLKEEGCLQWGTFSVRYASPQTVACSLLQLPHRFSAANDLWALGMVLFEAATGASYWHGWEERHIIEALMGVRRMPHELDESQTFFAGCAELEEVVEQLLQREAAHRLTMEGIIYALARRFNVAVDESSFAFDKDALRYIEKNLTVLRLDRTTSSSISRTSSDFPDDSVPDGLRKQLCAIHRITAGQDLLISMQIWTDEPGRRDCRQLCPMAVDEAEGPGGGGGFVPPGPPLVSGSATEPVFQFVVGKTYFLTFYVQNRDLASPKRMPFGEVIEVRMGVGAQGDTKHVNPHVREASGQAWWGEVTWLPTTFKHPLCQDATLTSLDSPGTMWVSLLLSVPHMSGPMRVKHSLKFNMNPAGTNVGHSASASVDLRRSPALAKREMVRFGVAFGARLGGRALEYLNV